MCPREEKQKSLRQRGHPSNRESQAQGESLQGEGPRRYEEKEETNLKKCQREKGDRKREKDPRKTPIKRGKKDIIRKQAQQTTIRGETTCEEKGEKPNPRGKKYNHCKKSMRGLQQMSQPKEPRGQTS